MMQFRKDSESGFTLIELMVAMFILVSVGAVFSVSFNEVQHGIRKQQDEVDTQQAIRNAFDLLDSGSTAPSATSGPVGLRYASAVNDPVTANGSQYIEWVSGDASGTQLCTQWRATATGTLQWRQWAYNATTTSPGFTTAATGLVVTGTPVFSTTSAVTTAANPTEREVQVTLTDTAGVPMSRAVSQSVFTAANTSSATAPTPAVCQDIPNPRP